MLHLGNTRLSLRLMELLDFIKSKAFSSFSFHHKKIKDAASANCNLNSSYIKNSSEPKDNYLSKITMTNFITHVS